MSLRLSRTLLFRSFLLLVLCTALFVAFGNGELQAQGAVPQRDALLDQLAATTGGELVTTVARQTNNLSFVRATGDAVLVRDDATQDATRRALTFLENYGALMGIHNPAAELDVTKVVQDEVGATHVRMEQRYRGLPVFGAEIVVHMDDRGITALNGTYVPAIELSTSPTLSSAAASRIALGAVAKTTDGELTATTPALFVYRSGLLEGFYGENHLAFAVEVIGEGLRQQVWVDARSGTVLNSISMIHTDLYREVYTPTYEPGNLVREEGDPPISPIPGTNPVDNLYDFSGQTYNLFFNAFERDSFDGAGSHMQTVYLVNENCPNAYWDGARTNYCPGFDLDDVVAHEWGHAYTQHTHNLVYQYQSGALNESYSDVWGETLDLFNGRDGIGGSNNSQPYPSGQRWLVGEDLPVVNQVILRNMWDPTTHGGLPPIINGDPDKVTSPNYYCGTGDNGGVHYNSGVPNHGFAMLVDGKSFNGQTVEGIGFVRATHIYWRAGAVYQVRSSNFIDHADALEASCADLIGQPLKDFRDGTVSADTITADTCQQVANMALAVELRTPPTQCNYQPMLDPNTPALCNNAQYFFMEDWETGMDGWDLGTEAAPSGDSWPPFNWEVRTDLPDGRSGNAAFAIDDSGGTCGPGGDISGHFWMDSPEFTMQNGGELRFEHWVSTELEFDGGNLKASINGGAYALVPASAMTFNPYSGALSSTADGNTNPLAGEDAWTGTDGGTADGSWGTTIVDLSALAAPGDAIRLRWDFGVDGCNGVTGWYIDTVEAHTCTGSPTAVTLGDLQSEAPAPLLPAAALGLLGLVAAGMLWRHKRA